MYCLALLTVAITTVAAFRAPPHQAANVVEDAHLQAGQKLRCFYNTLDGEVHISEPIYTMCSYMLDPSGAAEGLVNGISEESEDFADSLDLMERRATSKSAMLIVCSQEAYQLNDKHMKSQIMTRCLCRRSGCNLPKSIAEYFNYNKKILPQIA